MMLAGRGPTMARADRIIPGQKWKPHKIRARLTHHQDKATLIAHAISE